VAFDLTDHSFSLVDLVIVGNSWAKIAKNQQTGSGVGQQTEAKEKVGREQISGGKKDAMEK